MGGSHTDRQTARWLLALASLAVITLGGSLFFARPNYGYVAGVIGLSTFAGYAVRLFVRFREKIARRDDMAAASGFIAEADLDKALRFADGVSRTTGNSDGESYGGLLADALSTWKRKSTP